ncbi:MAG: hypothetical protein KDK99_06755 [Verrucomicrobiales bacterium]|nr:hypothetical protein [Verrucomicrobiales bacterium]
MLDREAVGFFVELVRLELLEEDRLVVGRELLDEDTRVTLGLEWELFHA